MSKRRTIILSDAEDKAVKSLLNSPLAERFSMGERDVIRYLLKNGSELFAIFGNQQSEITATKMAVRDLSSKIESVLDKVVELAKETRGRPKRANAKVTPAEEYEAGRLICEELGGIVQGNMCVYKKYEITPAGTPFESEVGLDLTALTERMIDDQYFPSREEYERLLKK